MGLWWIAGIVLLLVVVGMPIALSSAVVNRRFQFPDPLTGKVPLDFGIPFRDITFTATPGLALRGWYLPGSSDETIVVFCHGLNRSRVELLPQAQFVHSLGLSSVLFDLRHHGASEGTQTTLGAKEKDDVLAAVAWVRKTVPHRHIVLWGISMGAASAMLAAAEDSEVSAVISDSSYLSFADTIRHHFRLFFRVPSWPLADVTGWMMQWRGGFKAEEIDVAAAVTLLDQRPVLFVGQTLDARVPPDIARRLFELSTSPHKRLLILEGRRHGRAYGDHVQQYQEAVKDFFQAAGVWTGKAM